MIKDTVDTLVLPYLYFDPLYSVFTHDSVFRGRAI